MKFDSWDYFGLFIFLAIIAGYWIHWLWGSWRRTQRLITQNEYEDVLKSCKACSLTEELLPFQKAMFEQLDSESKSQIDNMTFEKLKKIKSIMNAGGFMIPSEINKPFIPSGHSDMQDAAALAMHSCNFTHTIAAPKLEFKPAPLSDNVRYNIEIYDAAMMEGYNLNLITREYYKP